MSIFSELGIVGSVIALILALLVLLMLFKEIPTDWDNALIMLIIGI